MIALVFSMVWARRGQALVVALLAMFGVAAAVAAPAYLRAADRATASGQVETAAAEDLAIAVRAYQSDPRTVKPGADLVGPDLERNGSVLLGMPGFDYVYSVEYPTIGVEPSISYATRFVYRQDACEHLVMTAGRCLIGEADIILPEATGRRLELAPGDSIQLRAAVRVVPRGEPPFYAPVGVHKQFLVAGFYRVPDPRNVYWGTHAYFAPSSGLPPGANEPAFVGSATLHAMDRGAVEAGLDAYPRAGALDVDNLPAVRDGLVAMQAGATSLGGGVEMRSELPALLDRIDSGRDAGHRIVPVLAVALVLLACLTIFLAVGYGTEGRRPELAVVALRGARWGQRWWLATGENLVAILIGAVLGCLAGQLLVNAFSAYRFPGVGADPGLDSLRWAPVAAGAAVLTALLAERRQIATPVAELLRRAPSVPTSARAIAVEAVVVILAGVAVVQLTDDLRGVGTAAAALVLVAGSLVAARLLIPLATLLGRRALRRSRIGVALAGFQLSRRPGAVRLFALLTAAVAVIGYAASAVDVAARGRVDESVLGTGAQRVIELGPTGRPNLLAAVRAVDPEGKFAMAAMRLPKDPAAPTVVAVDTTRLATVAAWPSGAPAVESITRALHPAAAPPVDVDGAKVAFDITADGFRPGKAVAVSVVLSPRDGGNDEIVELGVLRDGRQTYGQTVPACAKGCTLNSVRIVGGTGTLDVSGHITVHKLTGGAPGNGVPGDVLTDPSRWRASEGGEIGRSADGLRIDVTSLNGLPSGMFVQPAAAPDPLPVATAGIGALPTIEGLDSRPVRVSVAAALPAVPGAGAPAVLTDLTYADALATDGAASSNALVWLNSSAPADIVDQLAAHGVTVTADVRASQVRARLDTQGPAIALWFYVIVAVLAAALAAGALILAASVDRDRRVEDLSALRGQGLSRAALRQATLWTYPVLIAVAVVAGLGVALLGWWLTGWALPLAGLTPPAIPLAGWPRPVTIGATALATLLMLAGVAVLAGRRTLRRIR
ncbi:ABC transporter permease [Actinoplanes sp. LDG1-06]|uniref:ABC transporter permease n=1 Tax=Paractinoplanes ovalisporus TaxID=2810368 RepID=A0ABS2AIT8_9ACTN|nr:FtsX-like permease family protein [Actinoplanes ovalisporus]MBM2619736.1 ABC transporter permease [Actinoplanes ovalisporus]